MRCYFRGCNRSRNGNETILCLTHSDIVLRTVICTQSARDIALRAVAEDLNLFEAFLYTVCAFSKMDFEPQRRRALECRAFVAHKPLLLQPQQVVVVRLGSLRSSSHAAKNFAFIFDIQAQVRLFLPCGDPCVRSTSDCAVLLATPGAQSAVA